LEIEKLTYGLVGNVAALHSKLMPYSMNSLMGPTRIHSLYHSSLNDENLIVYIARHEDRVSSFISGTSDYEKSVGFGIRTIRFTHLLHLIFKNNPILTILTAIDTIQIARGIRKIASNSFCLTSWGADSEFGFETGGSQVFRKMLIEAKASSRKYLIADVRRKNKAVVEMYWRIGFTTYKNTLFSRILIKVI
jgi:hypothetical protein